MLAVIALLLPFYFLGAICTEDLSIFVVAIAFTWFHVSLALKMCFYPVGFQGFEFLGVRIGWEGIIPQKARKMAEKSCDLIVDRLIYVNKVLDRIDPEALWLRLEREGVAESVGEELNVRFKGLPTLIRNQFLKRQKNVSKRICVRFVSCLINHLKNRSVFDVSEMIIDEFSRNKTVLVELFTKVGAKELILVERSGILMGLLCGFFQILLYKSSGRLDVSVNPYVLFAVTGTIIGLVTNWLSLFVIFNPINPVTFFNKITFHSLFLRRQEEVSRTYSKIVTQSILNVNQVISHLKDKGTWTSVVDMFNQILEEEIETEFKKSLHFIYSSTLTRHVVVVAQDILVHKGEEWMTHHVVPFIEDQIQLETQLYVSLINLTYKEFDGILHPVFQEDESTLILLGGVLGGLVGVLQVWFFDL
jgi:uncharacterized membrane protein YheB (UPF0754 family)